MDESIEVKFYYATIKHCGIPSLFNWMFESGVIKYMFLVFPWGKTDYKILQQKEQGEEQSRQGGPSIWDRKGQGSIDYPGIRIKWYIY